MRRIIFVTGTDTGVGKTALTALLLARAQEDKISVRALKPFSSGGMGDQHLLGALQGQHLPINFFHYPEAIAPWAAARLHGRKVGLEQALDPIRENAVACELLLVEGAGGLLSPLGERFSALELIQELEADVIIAAANRVGVLNHTLLTVRMLPGETKIKVALIEHAGADVSRKTNLENLRELLPGRSIVGIPFLANYRPEAQFIRGHASRLREPLGELLA
jgi:dethiobiotin synthase